MHGLGGQIQTDLRALTWWSLTGTSQVTDLGPMAKCSHLCSNNTVPPRLREADISHVLVGSWDVPPEAEGPCSLCAWRILAQVELVLGDP